MRLWYLETSSSGVCETVCQERQNSTWQRRGGNRGEQWPKMAHVFDSSCCLDESILRHSRPRRETSPRTRSTANIAGASSSIQR